MATIAETHHDEQGLKWPVAVAPYEAVITVLKLDEPTLSAAEDLYRGLRSRGIDVLLDDRDARAGVKFADAELIGIPYRLTVGPRSLADGEVELTVRANGDGKRVAQGGDQDITRHEFSPLGGLRCDGTRGHEYRNAARAVRLPGRPPIPSIHGSRQGVGRNRPSRVRAWSQ